MMRGGLQSDSNSLDVLLSLADLYVQNGLIEEAKGLLKTAIEKNKNVAEPYLNLGKIYLKEGNRQRAIKILKQAEKIEPENKTLQELLSSIVVEETEEIEGVEELAKVEEAPLKDSLKRELNKLLKMQGVVGVVLVDEGGALIHSELSLPLDEDTTGVIINTIYNRIEETTDSLDLGSLKEVLFELPGGNIFVLGTAYIRFIVLTKRDIPFADLERKIREVFFSTKDILEVD